MFKKIMALCLVFTIGLSFFACGAKNEDANASKSISSNHYIDPDDPYPLYHNCVVSVNGKALPYPYYAYFDQELFCFAVPLVVILEELGIDAQWKSASVAEIWFHGKQYILNTETPSFVLSDEPTENLFVGVPGSYSWYAPVPGDYLVDLIALEYFLVQFLDVDRDNVRIFLDDNPENASVSLTIMPVVYLPW